jgi:hypothetical protein
MDVLERKTFQDRRPSFQPRNRTPLRFHEFDS